jgi:GTPase SAR1 family protein
MGGTISRLWTSEPIWVGLVGIQSAGKTAIVYRLSGNNAPVTPSTDSESPQYDKTTNTHKENSSYFHSDLPGKPAL